MFQLGRGSNQPAAQQELNARLQVRQVRHRHQQLAARYQHAMEFGKRARLVFERQVLEDIEAQRAIERAVGIGRAVRDPRRTRADEYDASMPWIASRPAYPRRGCLRRSPRRGRAPAVAGH